MLTWATKMSDFATQAKVVVWAATLAHHIFYFLVDKDASTRRRICSCLSRHILRCFASEANNKMARAALRKESSVARHFARITRTAAHLLIISWLQFVLFPSKQQKMRHCESSIHPCRETSCEVAAVAHCWQAIFNYEYDFSDNNELSTINHSVICLRAGGDEDEDKEWWTESVTKCFHWLLRRRLLLHHWPHLLGRPFHQTFRLSDIQTVIDMDTLM